MDLSRKEFNAAIKDQLEQKEAEIKMITRSISEVIRTQTMHLMNLSGKTLQNEIDDSKMKRIFPFPWDQERIKDQSIGEMKTLAKSIAISAQVKRTTSGLRKRKRK